MNVIENKTARMESRELPIVSCERVKEEKARKLRSSNREEENQCEVSWETREEKYLKEEARQLCLMLLNDLSRSRSMVILMRRHLVGQKRIIRMD